MESAAGTSAKRTLKSSARRGKALPRKAQDLSKEELLLTLQKKKECNARALKIVEGMLETNVKEDWFLDVLQHLNQSHFQDIIEERSITRLCGYPLCSNELQNIPSQLYRISTKLNKVFDIQERKNFCSNKCFKASKFIKDQLHTSPLWLRDIEPSVKYTLIPSTEVSGGAGDEVKVQVERVTKEEVKQLSRYDNLKAGTSSVTSLADVLTDLHIASSLRENAAPNLNESPSPTHKKVGTPENVAVANNQEGILIRDTKETHSTEEVKVTSLLKCNETENCSKSVGNSCLSPEDSSSKEDIQNALKSVMRESILDVVEEKSNIGCGKTNDTLNEYQEETKPALSTKGISGRTSPNLLLLPRKTEDNGGNSEKGDAKHKDVKDGADDGQDSVICHAYKNEVQQNVTEYLNSIEGCLQNTTQLQKEPMRILHNTDLRGTASHSTSIKRDLKQTATKNCVPKEHKKRQKDAQSNSALRSLSIVSHVERCVEEWFTMETMCFLFGEGALKDMLQQKGESIQAHYKALSTATWDQEKHERFLAICKRLSLLELEDNNFDSQAIKSDGDTRRKPLPDYEALKKEAETMELKVKAFYSGTIEMEDRKVSFAEDTKSASTADCDKEIESQLPLVHLHSQRALRKKIVLDGLNRVLPDFLRTFGMRPSELTASIRGLISTFALSSTNITFKPQEWSLLGLIIIKLLSLREPELKQCLSREQSNTYLTLMLMSYKQEPGYLERLLSWLTDVDKLLARPQPSENT